MSHGVKPPASTSPSAFTVLIPARLASTRLPNKPLADIAGLPMVVRVAQRAQQSKAERVVVAADDELILQACQQHGVQALLTDKDHASGSDRLAQACAQLGLQGDDIVVNVQGDEPLMDPALIDEVAALLSAHTDASMGTAAHAIASQADYLNPNVVKVVLDGTCRAQRLCRLCTAAPRRHLQLPGRFSEAVSAAAPGAYGSCRGTGAAQGPVAWPPHCRPYRRCGPWPRCGHPRRPRKSSRYFGVAGPSPLSRVQGVAHVPSVSQSQAVTCYPCPPQEHGILDAAPRPC